MLGRRLACSFCGKGEANVAKLVAGPRVYICDQCAAEVIRIMEESNHDPSQSSPSPKGLLGRSWDRILRAWPGGRRHIPECHVVRPPIEHAV
jgi:hypothetical protein